jgi:hypothetical protein
MNFKQYEITTMVNYIIDYKVWIKNVGGDLDAADASLYF